MSELSDRYGRVEERIATAVAAVESDAAASPVLVAVVKEFQKKGAKAKPLVESDDGHAAREAIVEVEQAGDSAKAAAEADPGITAETRQAVLDAHDRICVLKTKMAPVA